MSGCGRPPAAALQNASAKACRCVLQLPLRAAVCCGCHVPAPTNPLPLLTPGPPPLPCWPCPAPHPAQATSGDPVKVFDRAANLEQTQIISYRVDPTEKWCVLVGIAPGAPERPQLVKGAMQLYSVEQGRSQALEAHAAAFTTLALGGRQAPVISFAQKTLAPGGGGQVVSKLHVIELGLPGQTSLKKSAELFFPPEFADDFPVSMQIRCGGCGLRLRLRLRLRLLLPAAGTALGCCPSCCCCLAAAAAACRLLLGRRGGGVAALLLASAWRQLRWCCAPACSPLPSLPWPGVPLTMPAPPRTALYCLAATSTAWSTSSPSWACCLCTTWRAPPRCTAPA